MKIGRLAAALALVAVVGSMGVPDAPSASAATKIEEYPVPTADSAPAGITAGPDGNLWFTESAGNKIGMITPSGEITEFAIPTAASAPAGITAGPDGNLWFTESAGNKIGMITPSGTITEFPIRTEDSQPIGITSGDRNVWFTELGGNVIGSLRTSGGRVQESPLPTGGSAPAGIATGPDGTVWFTESEGNRIGLIEDGEVTEFPVPTADAGPSAIVAGLDGNMWFTESSSGMVASITRGGEITEHRATAGAPSGIAPGPDGNVWFTDMAANLVASYPAAEPRTAYVLGIASGYTPRSATATLGSRVRWTFLGPSAAAVSDASGLRLFVGRPTTPVDSFTFKYPAAGTFSYQESRDESRSGTVGVQLVANVTEARAIRLRWALAGAGESVVFDVQVKRPGSNRFARLETGTTERSATFQPDAGRGTYEFRARIRSARGGGKSGWSPETSIRVRR